MFMSPLSFTIAVARVSLEQGRLRLEIHFDSMVKFSTGLIGIVDHKDLLAMKPNVMFQEQLYSNLGSWDRIRRTLSQ